MALELLKNAVISSEGMFPSCQDTGTAMVIGKKGESLLIDGDMHDASQASARPGKHETCGSRR